MCVSFWLRFNGEIPASYLNFIFYFILLSLGIKLFFLFLFDLYKIFWRYVSLNELIRIFKALSLSTLTLGLGLFLLKPYFPFQGFPRSILFIDYIVTLCLIGLLRISRRIYLDGFKYSMKSFRANSEPDKKRILIVGAGSAGKEIVQEMLRNGESEYFPVGFIDDDPSKQGVKVHGVKVLGTREDMPDVLKNNNIDEILVALPTARSKEIKKVLEIIRNSNRIERVKILPSIVDLMNGKVALSDIHEISLNDLLGRDPVQINKDIIRDFIRDKKILITGAGGSIGAELSRAILKFHPSRLIALDIDETEISKLINEMGFFKERIIPIIGDIRDKTSIEYVFNKYLPNVVFHTAAYKQVPILESFPEEAVKTNILGTKNIAELSLNYKIEKFINISTDKAVNPTSIMGVTKLATEELVKALNSRNRTKFTSVRFGNVLGSRGSVVPVFKRLIEKGGPVTVTHPDMKRYFMSISEAVLLVLEASALGEGGEIFVLDMGNPIEIFNLAKEMIRLSGYEPDMNIPIIFTKPRPGEKLSEKLWADYEEVEKTDYPKILQIKNGNLNNSNNLLKDLDSLIELSYKSNSGYEIIRLFKKLFPSYKHKTLNL